jgi:hypothetical protein
VTDQGLKFSPDELIANLLFDAPAEAGCADTTSATTAARMMGTRIT